MMLTTFRATVSLSLPILEICTVSLSLPIQEICTIAVSMRIPSSSRIPLSRITDNQWYQVEEICTKMYLNTKSIMTTRWILTKWAASKNRVLVFTNTLNQKHKLNSDTSLKTKTIESQAALAIKIEQQVLKT